METRWFAVNVVYPSQIPLAWICAATILFWMVVGIIIDLMVRKSREWKKFIGEYPD